MGGSPELIHGCRHKVALIRIRHRPPDDYNAYNRKTLPATLLILAEIDKKARKVPGKAASTWAQRLARSGPMGTVRPDCSAYQEAKPIETQGGKPEPFKIATIGASCRL